MYEYIKGTYEGMNKDYIIVENNHIGYRIFTSGSTIAKMPKKGEMVKLFLHQIVREDFLGLYGFLTEEELNLFNKLLTINGVGAKATLSLLSICSVDNLKYAIITGDEKTIIRAPGVGKKIAQRIILELKDKIKPEELSLEGLDLGQQGQVIERGKLNEALEALVALGYSQKEAEGIINKVDKTEPIEAIIKQALRLLME